MAGEFVLADWKAAGLNVTSAAKRGMYTIHQSLVIKTLGSLSVSDTVSVDASLRGWLGL
jgi:mRNA interferase MazF